ncbi:hypothetical protein [Plantactinospora sonchi]|uniref:Uncharacterized protein n=1 Tax=Plantactinospora sonchi TaxID=1544735 RepID=A0ABU7RPN4_9ACTN
MTQRGTGLLPARVSTARQVVTGVGRPARAGHGGDERSEETT